MLIGGIVAAVMVVALIAALLTRRSGRNDEHSVEGYHRSLHTLETINAHPAAPCNSALPRHAGMASRAVAMTSLVVMATAATLWR